MELGAQCAHARRSRLWSNHRMKSPRLNPTPAATRALRLMGWGFVIGTAVLALPGRVVEMVGGGV